MICWSRSPESVDVLLAYADAQTYKAKRAGKDRIHQAVVDPAGAPGVAVGAG